jgi:hypothetical protein
MPRESTIQVYRSTTTDIPAGLTFGEIAYSTVNNRVFIGDQTGNSIWVGAGVTTGTIATNSSVLIPTQSAVKTYVDSIVGGGSVVNSINGTGGNITVTGDSGSQQVSVSGTTTTITNRLATASLTGVASFPLADFAVSNGSVSLTGNVARKNIDNSFTSPQTIVSSNLSTQYGHASISSSFAFNSYTITTPDASANVTFPTQSGTLALERLTVSSLNGLTGARTLTGDGGALQGVAGTAITARVASASVTGVASFDSNNFTVSAAGAVALRGAVTSINGATGAYALPVASTSVTGVASFDTNNFSITAGAVSIKGGGVPNTALANSSITVFANASNTINLGGTLTITGTANQVAVSSSSGTVTLGLPNDITIPGNLTVNGTVVTANVNNFVVEDPLFMLGTGNAADSVDLGFYGQYVSTGTRYAGLFRDASDSGKFKLFAGLTAEPTTFVDNSFSSFAVATLVAKVDGGTF